MSVSQQSYQHIFTQYGISVLLFFYFLAEDGTSNDVEVLMYAGSDSQCWWTNDNIRSVQ